MWRFAISSVNEFVSDYSISRPEATFSLFEQGMAKLVDRSLLVVSTVVRDVDGMSRLLYSIGWVDIEISSLQKAALSFIFCALILVKWSTTSLMLTQMVLFR